MRSSAARCAAVRAAGRGDSLGRAPPLTLVSTTPLRRADVGVALERAAVRGLKTVRCDRAEHGLHVFRVHARVAAHESPGLRRAHERDPRARRQTGDELAGVARVADQRLHVVEQRLGRVNLRDLLLQTQQRVERQHGRELIRERPAFAAHE